MFNLLPKTEKDTVLLDYRTRLVIIILWFSFTTLLIASILLMPSLLLSSQREQAAERRFEILSQVVRRGNASEVRTVLADAQMRLRLLSHGETGTLLYEALMRMIVEKDEAISIHNISFTKAGGGGRYVDVTGRAWDRASLLAYARMLEQSGLFQTVVVPVSNFAKDTDIAFSLRAHGAFEHKP